MRRTMTPPHICVCPQCEGRMYEIVDDQGRKWAACRDCGAQIPLQHGLNALDFCSDNVFE